MKKLVLALLAIAAVSFLGMSAISYSCPCSHGHGHQKPQQ
jgi:hypothetical protein